MYTYVIHGISINEERLEECTSLFEVENIEIIFLKNCHGLVGCHCCQPNVL